MTVSRGNFIIDLLIEIDRSAEPDRFDQPMGGVLGAPQPEPVGKPQEVRLVEQSWQRRDAVYPPIEPQGLRWPDLQAPQQNSLELELQNHPATPQGPGIRRYALDEFEALPVPPQHPGAREYRLNRERDAFPEPLQNRGVRGYRPPNRDFEAFPAPPEHPGVRIYAPNREVEVFLAVAPYPVVRGYATNREFEALPAPPQRPRFRGYAPDREFEALPAPYQNRGVRGYAPNREPEALPALYQRPGSGGYAPDRGNSARTRSTHIVPRPALASPAKQAAADKGWLNLVAVFVSGAVIGLAGYAYLQESLKLREVRKLRPPALTASTIARPNQPVATPNRAGATGSSFGGVGQEAPPKQAQYEPGAANRTTDETMAQPARDTVLGPAPIQTRHAAVSKPQPAHESPPELSPELSDDELLAHAASRLQSGDLQGARAAYKVVAGRGNMRGAFSLAQTYDPDFLAPHRIGGAKPDVNLARRWYEKAAKLGDQEASGRLKELKELQDKSSASGVLRR